MATINLDCVKLQRHIRDRAHQKYGHVSLKEEMARISQNLKVKGLDHLFPEPRKSELPSREAAKRR